MASNEIKIACRTLRLKAFRQAEHRAECESAGGFGDLPDALASYASFVELWPRLAKHITKLEYVRAYRAAPHWIGLRRMRAEGSLPGGVGIGDEYGRKSRKWREADTAERTERGAYLEWNPYAAHYMRKGSSDTAVIASIVSRVGLTRVQAARALRRAKGEK